MTNPQNQQKFKLGKALISGLILLTSLGIFQVALSQLRQKLCFYPLDDQILNHTLTKN